MARLKTLLRDPLLHFVLVGIIAYAGLNAINPQSLDDSGDTIRVTDKDLIALMQKRDRVFDQKEYTSRFSALSDHEKQQLQRTWVEQEVLFREAKKLGLDQNDDVYRQRLIQRMRYFLDEFSASGTALDQTELLNYFKQNSDSYRIDANISFTHVFIKSDQQNRQKASAIASKLLSEAGESSAIPQIDVFPYHRNYVSKTESQVSRHFGRAFAKGLFDLEPNEQWQGPINSAYGSHLVLISEKRQSHLPSFEEVLPRVKEDAIRLETAKEKQAQIDRLVGTYEIVLDDN